MKTHSLFIKTTLLITVLFTIESFATFSICAIDSVTQEVGSAGASCIGAPQLPEGCLILSDVHPGAHAWQISYRIPRQQHVSNA